MRKNFISILITNYNKEKFLKKSLKSISNQTFKNYEVILYDDCSSDNSLKIIRKFKKVSFNVSCDHYGIKESWIRYPIDITSFENNLKRYREYISQIQVTVGMLNGTDLIEIRDYYNSNFELNVDFTNLVFSPTKNHSVSIRSFPKEHKLLLIELIILLPNFVSP